MRPRAEQPAVVLILRMLDEVDLTSYGVAKRLGIDVRNARYYMKLLHETKKVHIVSWAKGGIHGNGPPIPVWTAGMGTDAPRPVAMDGKTQMAKLRARRRNVVGLTQQLFRRSYDHF